MTATAKSADSCVKNTTGMKDMTTAATPHLPSFDHERCTGEMILPKIAIKLEKNHCAHTHLKSKQKPFDSRTQHRSRRSRQ